MLLDDGFRRRDGALTGADRPARTAAFKMMRDHHHASASWLPVLGAVLILVVLPRFDRHDWGLIDRFTTGGAPARAHLYDAGQYVEQVLYFRGERDEPTISPFVYRWAVPLVASWLPLAPLTAINVVNVALLQIGMAALWATLGLVTTTPLAQVLGTALYVVSFGTFFYGAVGYVDASALGVLSVGMWLVVSQRWLGVAAVLAFGPFVKESTLALVPMVAGWLRYGAGYGWRLVAVGTVAAGLLGLAGLAGAREGYGGWTGGWMGGGVYSLSLDNAVVIASQGEEILKMLLSLGVAPLVILVLLTVFRLPMFSADSIAATRSGIGKLVAPFFAGALGAGAFVPYGWLCCDPGGRLTWLASLFLIPVAMIMLDRIVQDRPELKCRARVRPSRARSASKQPGLMRAACDRARRYESRVGFG